MLWGGEGLCGKSKILVLFYLVFENAQLKLEKFLDHRTFNRSIVIVNHQE